MRPGAVDYASSATPAGYVCSSCKKGGLKLWRQAHTMLSHLDLLCCDCAGTDQDVDVSAISAEGRVLDRYLSLPTDQIGGLVPAVPTEEGDTYWGYSSVPQAGVLWWRRLPNRAPL